MITEVKIIDTTLRDAHQSLISTRMTIEEILMLAKDLDQVGFYAMEVWGGATFDVCHKYLNENPWSRLKQIKAVVKKTKLQMLLRGQNLVGYKPYANDTVRKFIKKSVEYGIDIIRIFDALNDFDNLITPIKATLEAGAHCQVALAYTISPYHDNDYYLNLAIKAKDLGAHSICIKDMSGILNPYNARFLVKIIKESTGLPVNIHSHDTSGIISATYFSAIEAGVDIIDTAISPFSSGNSQPPTESFINLLYSHQAENYFNISALNLARENAALIREKYINNGTLNFGSLTPYPDILYTQVPGGMLSNLFIQLKEQGQEHRFQEVISEIPIVRADLGFPPLVTPISQFVGVQATLNIIFNDRYKIIPNEIKKYLNGSYGKIIGPISNDILKKLDFSLKPAPLNYEFDEFTLLRNSCDLSKFSDENILSKIIIGESFILEPDLIDDYFLDEKKYKIDVSYYEQDEIFINSPFNSMVIEILKSSNETIKENDVIMVLINNENIKINIIAPCDGMILEFLCQTKVIIKKNFPLVKMVRNKY